MLCVACCAAGLAATYLTLTAHGALIGRIGVHLDIEQNVTFPVFTYLAVATALISLGSIGVAGLLGLLRFIRPKPCLCLLLYHLLCACVVQTLVVASADRIEDRLEARDIVLPGGAGIPEAEIRSSLGPGQSYCSLFIDDDSLVLRVRPIPVTEVIPKLVERLRQAGYDAQQRKLLDKRAE